LLSYSQKAVPVKRNLKEGGKSDLEFFSATHWEVISQAVDAFASSVATPRGV
jgi:hypothetical protein